MFKNILLKKKNKQLETGLHSCEAIKNKTKRNDGGLASALVLLKSSFFLRYIKQSGGKLQFIKSSPGLRFCMSRQTASGIQSKKYCVLLWVDAAEPASRSRLWLGRSLACTHLSPALQICLDHTAAPP